MTFAEKELLNFTTTRDLEWLETNGLGGYASSTVSGAHSRRYHGLLVAAVNPPVGRMVVLSKLDETLFVPQPNGTGPKRYDLGTNQYPGVVYPEGYTHLKKFERGLFPVFYYEAGGVKLTKTIAAVHGKNTTLIVYEVTDAPAPFTLELLPLAAARDFHTLSHANEYIGAPYLFEKGVFRTLNYHGCPELFISVPKATFTCNPTWYYNFEYAVEQQRGMDFHEDLHSPGKFSITLSKGDTLGIIVSTEDPTGKSAIKLFDAEKKRREPIVSPFAYDESLATLAFAADQFIVKRKNSLTVIAGYHWFADWGRDTMIALPGLCLETGRHKDAKKILQQFAAASSEGMLPNRFPDQGEHPEYNTIDATLWFFQAIYKYYHHTKDIAFVRSMLPALTKIIEAHEKGLRYNIKVDASDGLLSGGEEGVQLTWMDARVGDWVVTPRRGKPVEINALWYNALRIMEYFNETTGKLTAASVYAEKATRVEDSFLRTFWNDKQLALYDCVQGDTKDDAVRPNQLYAISLPFALLPKDKAMSVLDIVTKKLLTPKGLRSLSADHPDYKPVYRGDIRSRDGAYHQGTVWSFLLGPYVDALLYCKGNEAREEATALLKKFFTHLREGGVGSVSEIFDAQPPHTPRGAIAQAWGVAEVLRVALQYKLFEAKPADAVPVHNVNSI